VCVHVKSSFRANSSICGALIKNLHLYARRHGYGLLLFNRNCAEPAGRSVLWSKFPALAYALARAWTPFVWWHDADSLFVDTERSLASLRPRHEASMTIAGDFNCFVNSGHLMLRKSQWSRGFLERGRASAARRRMRLHALSRADA
jgi:hypothetical protein